MIQLPILIQKVCSGREDVVDQKHFRTRFISICLACKIQISQTTLASQILLPELHQRKDSIHSLQYRPEPISLSSVEEELSAIKSQLAQGPE